MKYQQVAQESEKASDVKLAQFSIGACELSLKDCAYAGLVFEQFARYYPDDAQSPVGLTYVGNCYVEQGSFTEAESYYFKALEFKQSKENMRAWIGSAFLGLGKVLMHKGDYSDARSCLQQAINRSSDTKLTKEASDLIDQCSKEVDKPEQISKMSRTLGLVNYHIGRLYFDEKKYDQAVPYIQKAAPKLTDGNKLADCYLKLGEGLYNLKKYDEAIAALGSIAKIQDTTPAFIEKLPEYLATSNYWRALALQQKNK